MRSFGHCISEAALGSCNNPEMDPVAMFEFAKATFARLCSKRKL